MNKLLTELTRLYGTARNAGEEALALSSPAGLVRAMVLELGRPADWALLGAVWRGVQSDLALCAPAIAVNGVDGYQLWFSLETGVEPPQAAAFLQGLCQRYLADVAPARLRCMPDAAGPSHPLPMPPLQLESGSWSAFLAPDLAAVFADEPWLDRAPGEEAQASLLARLQSMTANSFHAALQRLNPVAGSSHPYDTTAPGTVPATELPATGSVAPTPSLPQEPEAFLLAVMNDPAVALTLRIQAAAALLPYRRPPSA